MPIFGQNCIKMKITGSNVTIMVKDMDRSVAFYQGLGFNLKQRWDNNYAMMSTEGLTIGIHPSDGIVRSSGSVSIGLFIEEVVDAKAVLSRMGVLFEEQNDEKSGIYLNFKDPDGTHLYYVKPKWEGA